MNYRELMIGCGRKRCKHQSLPTASELRGSAPDPAFRNLTTLDINRDHRPDVVCDLRRTPFHALDGYGVPMHHQAFPDNYFDEIHAYEVLEHIGQQGDAWLFFQQFAEFWRILKPEGFFFATCPSWRSSWAWGDPSHTRVITEGTLAFLSQKEYARQVGVTSMSDFRYMYKADFDIRYSKEGGQSLLFVLQAIK